MIVALTLAATLHAHPAPVAHPLPRHPHRHFLSQHVDPKPYPCKAPAGSRCL